MKLAPLTALTLLLLASPLIAADPLPTMTEIQADFDAAKYPECLQKIARTAYLTGPAAKDYDKYTLLMLKGDTLLVTKQGPLAVDAYAAAQKAATEKKDIAKASALQTLIKKSTALKYIPKGTEAKDGFDITDKTQRQKALESLYDTELAADQLKLKALLKAPELPPLVSFAPTINALEMLELATGKGTEATTMKKDLGDHARESIDTALAKLDTAVLKVQKNADELVERDTKAKDPTTGKMVTKKEYYKKGLTSSDQSLLGEAISTTERLAPMCKDLKAALDADFKSSLSTAEKVHTLAKEILATDYSKKVVR